MTVNIEISNKLAAAIRDDLLTHIHNAAAEVIATKLNTGNPLLPQTVRRGLIEAAHEAIRLEVTIWNTINGDNVEINIDRRWNDYLDSAYDDIRRAEKKIEEMKYRLDNVTDNDDRNEIIVYLEKAQSHLIALETKRCKLV